ncbi:hypothetical protein [Arhodomonas sp. SL1]|uniref:hypothetical protein n=1 Tax=Arhodomonas sp. SL1 TaxID=3425691 RepID=UPI003F884913
MGVIARLSELRRTRGLGGTLRFLAARLCRCRVHAVFLAERGVASGAGEPPAGVEALVLDGPAALARLKGIIGLDDTELAQYLADIRRGETVGVVMVERREVVHWAFLMRRSRTLCLLGAPPGAMLLGNAFTPAVHRGRGLQKASVRVRMTLAWHCGASCVVAETAPDNAASQRALEVAGMAPMGEIRLLVLANRLVFRRVSGRWRARGVGWCDGDG